MLFLFLIILVPLFILILIGLLLLPLHFLAFSVINIITVPYQLIKIAFNRDLRRNHALEHATINVIEEHFGPLNLVGFGKENGFVIQGPVEAELVEKAARTGLGRLKAGESELAVHQRCGTSMLAVNFVASALVLVLLWYLGYFGILYIVPALIGAQFIGPHLGKFFQSFVTTATDVQGMEIAGVGIETAPRLGVGGLIVGPSPRRFFVRTTKRVPD